MVVPRNRRPPTMHLGCMATKPKLQNLYEAADQNIRTSISNLLNLVRSSYWVRNWVCIMMGVYSYQIYHLLSKNTSSYKHCLDMSWGMSEMMPIASEMA